MDQELIRYCLRVSKKDSSFIYFILESNENLCFYSTLEESLKSSYRDIEIFVTKELAPNFSNLLEKIEEKVQVTLI